MMKKREKVMIEIHIVFCRHDNLSQRRRNDSGPGPRDLHLNLLFGCLSLHFTASHQSPPDKELAERRWPRQQQQQPRQHPR